MMKNILIPVIYVIVFILIFTGINYTENVNIKIITHTYTKTITSTVFTTTTVYTTEFFTKTSTDVSLTTVPTTVVQTATITRSITTSVFIFSSKLLVITTFVNYTLEGDGLPNVIIFSLYTPAKTQTMVTAFGYTFEISPYTVVEFPSGNTTSVVFPYVPVDLIAIRYMYTMADVYYINGFYNNFLAKYAKTDLPTDPIEYVNFLKENYAILSTFSSPLPLYDLLSTRTLDYYAIETLYIVDLIEHNAVPKIIMFSNVSGFAVSGPYGILYGTRSYSNIVAVVYVNGLASTVYTFDYNKYYGITTVKMSVVSVPKLSVNSSNFTLYETIISGTLTTVVNEVFSGTQGYLKIGSNPVYTVSRAGDYFVIINPAGETISTTGQLLPFVFDKKYVYYIGNNTISAYSTTVNGVEVIYKGGVVFSGSTAYYSYYAKYIGGATFIRAMGTVIYG